ncbi:MAG: hypothetical protein WKG52_12320 [Variovorax sp.]
MEFIESFKQRLFASLVPLLLSLAATGAAAQQDAERFPAAAVRFLGDELPAMDAAVADRNRDYFEEAMGRMLDFSDSWGFRTRANPALARYSMCTAAVSDYLVVGLCRFKLSTDTCTPTLAPTFDTNLQRCRELAARGTP